MQLLHSFNRKPTPERIAFIPLGVVSSHTRKCRKPLTEVDTRQTKTTQTTTLEHVRHAVRALTWHAVPLATSMGWDDGEELCLSLLWFSLCGWWRRSTGGRGGPGREAADRSLSSVMISSMSSIKKKKYWWWTVSDGKLLHLKIN